MSQRDDILIQIRPKIATSKIIDTMSEEEFFQNSILRPILKLQNPIFIAVFKNYIQKHKNTFYSLSLVKRMEYIENAVQKDIKFRNSLKGIIIGVLTVEEYALYIKNSSALNKRMMQMLVERLKDQMQVFEGDILV